jgi:hypothetical protein
MFTKNFYVVDQRDLASQALEDKITASHANEFFVISSAGFQEIMSSDHWEDSLAGYLGMVCRFPHKILCTASVDALMRIESATKSPVQLENDFFDTTMTKDVRGMLYEYRKNGLSWVLLDHAGRYRQQWRMGKAQAPMIEKTNVEIFQAFCDKTLAAAGREQMQELLVKLDNLQPVSSGDFISMYFLIVRLLIMGLRAPGFSREEIEKFIWQDSCTVRWRMLYALRVYDAVIKGRHPHGRFADFDYPLIASYGRGLLSKDSELGNDCRRLAFIMTVWEDTPDKMKRHSVETAFAENP